jgi:hypothetical protein
VRVQHPAAALSPAEPLPPAQSPLPAHPAQPATAAPERPVVLPERPVAIPESPAAVPERPAAAPLPPAGSPAPPSRPALTVRADAGASRPLPVVERALRTSAGARPNGWHDRVVVVPGGHRPGKPDQLQRDQARARLPLDGRTRIVVLGCTAGAGQTVTTLLTGQFLAALRGEAVAVLDLGPRPGSLTEQARRIPRLLPARQAAVAERGSEEPPSRRERGLQVVTADEQDGNPADASQLIDAVVARYPLTLADPAAAQVPRALQAADQLVLVAPASPDAAGALAMTLEWLDGHGQADLARRAVTVLNGVSADTAAHMDKAAAVATGRCRAIVRVPWDGQFDGDGALVVATVQAYTALAGVLISGLDGAGRSPSAQSQRGRP